MERRQRKRHREGLRVIQSRAAGVDIGSRENWVCAPPTEAGEPQVGRFPTTTAGLHALARWLHQQGVETVAMESTGTYWIALYDVLEEAGFEVVLVDARQLRKVPGRKTDMLDCQWIQQLHSCGLLRGCFRPSGTTRQLRELSRESGNLQDESKRVVQRMQKALDAMNIKIHHAVSDLTGVTGMAILRALVGGERDPMRLAQLRDRRCQKSVEEIASHLKGTWLCEHLFNLKMLLKHYEQLQGLLESYQQQILKQLQALTPPEREPESVPPHPNPHKEKQISRRGEQALRTALWRFSGIDLTRIDGISSATALTVMSEVGVDIHRFETSPQWVSWLRASPYLHRSAGKQQRRKSKGFGSNRIAKALRMAALSQKHAPTALGAYFRRMARRKGLSIAIGATARKIAEHLYRALRWGQEYVDQGAEAYEARFRENRFKYAQCIAKSMGYVLLPSQLPNEVSS